MRPLLAHTPAGKLTAATCAFSSGSMRFALPLALPVALELPSALASTEGTAGREARPPLSSGALCKCDTDVPAGQPGLPALLKLAGGVSHAWAAKANGLTANAPDLAREAMAANGLATVGPRSWKLRSTQQALPALPAHACVAAGVLPVDAPGWPCALGAVGWEEPQESASPMGPLSVAVLRPSSPVPASPPVVRWRCRRRRSSTQPPPAATSATTAAATAMPATAPPLRLLLGWLFVVLASLPPPPPDCSCSRVSLTAGHRGGDEGALGRTAVKTPKSG